LTHQLFIFAKLVSTGDTYMNQLSSPIEIKSIRHQTKNLYPKLCCWSRLEIKNSSIMKVAPLHQLTYPSKELSKSVYTRDRPMNLLQLGFGITPIEHQTRILSTKYRRVVG
jgi:hypothetical protein